MVGGGIGIHCARLVYAEFPENRPDETGNFAVVCGFDFSESVIRHKFRSLSSSAVFQSTVLIWWLSDPPVKTGGYSQASPSGSL
jgi:hypothetical protein